MGTKVLLALASLPPGQYTRKQIHDMRVKDFFPLMESMGKTIGKTLNWTEEDRIQAAIQAIQGGASVEEAGQAVGWRGFEAFTSFVMEAWGYQVKRNLRISGGRSEVDVVAWRRNLALVVECKKWRRGMGQALLARTAERVEEKARELVRGGVVGSRRTIPVIVTLQREPTKLVNKVPVVPLSAIRDFLQFVENPPFELRVVRAKARGPKSKTKTPSKTSLPANKGDSLNHTRRQ